MRKWIEKNYDYIANVGSAVLSVGLSILASFFYDGLKGEDASGVNWYILVTMGIFLIFFMFLFAFFSAKIKARLFKESDINRYIQKAYIAAQHMSLESQIKLQETAPEKLYEYFLSNIQLAVDKCYDFFYTSYGKSDAFLQDIKFEVTYMTLSYKDNKITIPCSCNQERRTPTSMLMRDKNPDIYEGTITADIYGECRNNCKPTLKIIEDTSLKDPARPSYRFIYDNQSDRIKSSVVLPVLSHKNELLGTLVVHCNCAGFFKEKQRAFWYEILQLFASEIGKNKLLLDATKKEGELPF